MKKILLGTAVSVAMIASQASAGTLADPVVEAPVIEAEAVSSSSGTALPVFLAVFMAVALAAGTQSTGAAAASDIRLKTDIQKVGMTSHGLPLYHFRYIGHDQMYEGVMAQDVLKVMPEAVEPLVQGYHAVNYGMLGLEMKKVY